MLFSSKRPSSIFLAPPPAVGEWFLAFEFKSCLPFALLDSVSR